MTVVCCRPACLDWYYFIIVIIISELNLLHDRRNLYYFKTVSARVTTVIIHILRSHKMSRISEIFMP